MRTGAGPRRCGRTALAGQFEPLSIPVQGVLTVPRGNFVFTSESVSEGHPDKVCGRISDAVVDAFLAADSVSRVACETLVTTNRIVIAGEVRGPRSLVAKDGAVKKEKIEAIVRKAVKDIGYQQKGFHWKKAK